MISHPAVLADMRRQLAALESDLRAQAAAHGHRRGTAIGVAVSAHGLPYVRDLRGMA